MYKQVDFVCELEKRRTFWTTPKDKLNTQTKLYERRPPLNFLDSQFRIPISRISVQRQIPEQNTRYHKSTITGNFGCLPQNCSSLGIFRTDFRCTFFFGSCPNLNCEPPILFLRDFHKSISKEMSTTSGKKVKEVPENTLIASLEPVRAFALDSYRLIKRCTKPDGKGALRLLHRHL